MSSKDRPARPWDLFNKNLGRVSLEISAARMEVCKSCDKFLPLTQQCKECWCVMPAKTTLPNASCPLHKWEAEDIDNVPFSQ